MGLSASSRWMWRGVRKTCALGRLAHGLLPPQGEIHRMKRLTTALEICALTVLTVSPVDGGAPLELVVTPVESFAPASVNIRARIQPNAHNRMITIVAVGPEFTRRSTYQLTGER